MYGTRRASLLFQNYVMEILVGIGFVRLKVACQVFWHKDRVINFAVHGDDFMVTAEPEGMEWMDHQLSEAFEIKIEGRVGPPGLGGKASGQLL